MNEFLKDFIGKFVIIYLDNILVYNKTREEHLQHLRSVMVTLQKENLLKNLKKCGFMKEDLIYLGFVIYKDGLNMDPDKV